MKNDLYEQRAIDQISAKVSMSTQVLLFISFICEVLNYRYWDIHWVGWLTGILTWAYAGLVIVVGVLCAIFLICIPIGFMLLKKPLKLTVGSYKFGAINFFFSVAYPIMFYYGGHPRLGVLAGSIVVSLTSAALLIAAIAPHFTKTK
jgi:hypothetical protein